VYDAIARMKVRAHWQSDVIAGFVLGTGAGYFAHARGGTPLVLSVMPHGSTWGEEKVVMRRVRFSRRKVLQQDADEHHQTTN